MKKSQFRNSILAVSVLSVSIASQLQAVTTFNSNGLGAGDWDDPASWLVGGLPTLLFPDTWLGDTAIIELGDLVEYTGGVTTPATPFSPLGSLSVASGGVITITSGGTLDQPLLTNEIRIGDGGAGIGTGTGTLNIDGGGSFKSGMALGVLIGSDLTNPASPTAGNGVGTVNLKDGLFLMGAGAAAGGLAVGVEGSTGTLNVGDGAGLAETANVDLKTNNIRMGIGLTNQIPGATAGTGTVIINRDGSISQGSGEIVVGDDGGNGTLKIGSAVLAGGKLGSGVVSTGEIRIGSDGGTGLFEMLKGGTVDTRGEFNVGRGTGSVGTVNLNFGATDMFNVGTTSVGRGGGTGTWNLNGVTTVATVNGDLYVGRDAGSVGALNLTGSSVNVTGVTRVGIDGGTGAITLASTITTYGLQIGTNGGTGTFTDNGGFTTIVPAHAGEDWVGRGPGSLGTLTLNASTMLSTSGQDFQVGYAGGTGIVNVTNGGRMNHNWWFNIGRDGTSTGHVTVDGPGSILNMTAGQIHVGENGTGTMDIKNGGKYLYNGGDTDSSVGRTGGSNGTLTIDTGGIFDGLTNPAEGDPGARHGLRLYLGLENDNSNGTLNMNNGTMSLLSFTPGNTGKGTVNHTGGTINVGQWSEIGQDRNVDIAGVNDAVYNLSGTGTFNTQQLFVGSRRKGTMNVSGGVVNVGSDGTVSNNGWGGFAVGAFGTPDNGSHGNGFLNQTGGTINSIRGLEVGNQAGTNGNYEMDGPTARLNITNGEAHIGNDGTGIFTVKNGAEAHLDGNWSAKIGTNNGSNGTVNVSLGGKILANNWIVLGAETGSTGTLNISDAGSLVESGTPGGGSHEGRFITGRLGTATVNQTGGTARADNWFAIGIDAGGTGTYNFDGGNIELVQPNFGDRNITVGNRGTGSLNITHGNVAGTTISDGAGGRINQFNVAGDSGGTGTLNINLTDPSGKIVSRELYAGWNNGANGTINILKGTLQTDEWVEIGRGQTGQNGTGTVNVDGNQAVWNRGVTGAAGQVKDMNIGQGEANNLAKGYLNVRNGGTVNQNWWINLARQAGSEGHILVDGAGSTINMINGREDGHGGDNNSQLNVGQAGTGTLRILNGGTFNHNIYTGGGVTIAGGGEVWIARDNGATGTMTVDGTNSSFNSFGREFRIAGNSNTGTLNITNGGVVNFSSHRENGVQADGNFGVAENGTGTGTINMNGGQLNIAAWSMFSAWNGAGTTATINMTNSVINILDTPYVDGGGNPGNGGHLFWGDSGTAVINQEGGAINAQGWSAIGRERGGNATYNLGVLGGGGVMTVGGLGGNELYVGRQSHGTINMGAGTSITVAGAFVLGQETSPTTPSTGTVINNGGTIVAGGDFKVGGNTVGVLGTFTQTAGSTTVNGEWQVGNDGATGVANISDGTVTAKSYVAIGRSFASSGGFQITNYATADAVIDGGPELAFSFAANYTTSNTQDNGDGGGPFGLGVQVQGLPGGDNSDFAFVGLGNFTVGTTGSYIFGNNTDDGSRLRLSINGGVFTQIITDDVLSGPHNAFSAPIALTLGDTIALEWMWFERGGGAEGESFYSRDGGSNALWQDATQGLTLAGGQYSGTVYKAALPVVTGSNGTVNLSGTGVITKTADNGGTFDIGSWNGGNATSNTTGRLNQSGGTVNNTVSDTHIGRDQGVVGNWSISAGTATLARLNVGNSGIGTLTMTGGSICATDRVSVGANGGSTGIANLNGGILTTNFIEAGGGTATLTFNGGTLQAKNDQSDFIRGFTNGGGHSAILLEGTGGTIDSNGFRVKVAAGGSVFSSVSDTNPTNGQLGAVLKIKGDATLALSDTDKVTLQTQVGDGVNHYLSIRVLAGGWLDDEVGQVLDNLTIDNGGYYELTALNSPPGAPPLPAAGGFDSGAGDSLAGSPIQGVPEPGTISLLLLSALGMLGRRNRGKKS